MTARRMNISPKLIRSFALFTTILVHVCSQAFQCLVNKNALVYGLYSFNGEKKSNKKSTGQILYIKQMKMILLNIKSSF